MSINNTEDDNKKIAQLFQYLGKIDKIIPTISTPALCRLLLENDALATTKPEKPDRRIFDTIISAALLPEMAGRMIIAHYVVFHVVEVIKLRKGSTDVNGYLPQNPIIWEKITPLECARVVQALDPENPKTQNKVAMRYAFNKFKDLVSRKEVFSPAKHWREIKREVAYAIVRAIAKRNNGKRYLSDPDEITVQGFVEIIEYRKTTGRIGLRTENKVYRIFREPTNEENGTGGGGLEYTPLCKHYDPYVQISIDPGSNEVFVLPLDKPLTFKLMNPLAMIEKDAGLNSFYFTLGAFVPIKNGDRLDHLTLLKEETIRSQSDKDGNVVFPNVILNASVKELKTATVEIKSFTANHDQYHCIMEEVIILPEGETELKVKSESFRSVVERFFNFGKMTGEGRDAALAELPKRDEFSAIDEILSGIDFTG